jgi:hypothetical protein
MSKNCKIRVDIRESSDKLVEHKGIRRSFEFDSFDLQTFSQIRGSSSLAVEQMNGKNQLVRMNLHGLESHFQVQFLLDKFSPENSSDILDLCQIHRQHQIALELRQRVDASKRSLDKESLIEVSLSCIAEGRDVEMSHGNLLKVQIEPSRAYRGREFLKIQLTVYE